MLKKISNVISGIIRERKKNKTRSSKWRSVRKEFLKNNPRCCVCGTKTLVQVHHIKPFAQFPELELEYTNLVTLCMFKSTCHFLIGHGGNWDCYNPYLAIDIDLIKKGSPINYIAKKASDYKLEIKSKD